MSILTTTEQIADFLNQHLIPSVRSDCFAVYRAPLNGEKASYSPLKRELTRDDLVRHLTGEQPMGTFMLQAELGAKGLTLAAVVDIDDKAHAYTWEELCKIADELYKALAKRGLICWPCRSGSGHGIHLWLFWPEPQDANLVRRILKKAVKQVIGDKLHVDIFPAQDRISADGLGNLVALPFARASRPVISLAEGTIMENLSSWLPTSPPLSANVVESDEEPKQRRPKSSKVNQTKAYRVATIEEVNGALEHVPADDHDIWFKVGFALKDAVQRKQFSDSEAEESWRTWSQKSAKFDEREQERWWRTQQADGRVTLGTIFHLAKENGWEPSSLGGRPVIQVTGGGLSEQAFAGEEALIKAEAPFYQRGSMLVQPIVEEVEAAKGRRTKIAHLSPVQTAHMVDWLCQTANWQRFDPDSGKTYFLNPPTNVANTILSRWGIWKFPRVTGVITTPTLRPDGTLLYLEGYDEVTGLILVDPPSMPEISESPSKEEALKCLAVLNDLLDEFPFVDAESRSVALSAILTPVVRGAFAVVPMHAIRAPSAGSGKSFLLDLVATIATGQLCPVLAAGRSEEETEKRLGAALLAGQAIISIDNVNGDLGGDFICQLVERPLVEVRPLGRSEVVKMESRSTVFATGNNLRLVADMTRRVILCTLDAKEEQPEHRQFKHNPVETVHEDRGKYVAAALTVIRAYIVAGKPDRTKRLASFGDWSDLVRSALVWLDKADPVATMEVARSEDPALLAMREVFAAIKEVVGVNRHFTSASLVQLAMESDQVSRQLLRPELNEALHNATGGRPGIIDSRNLGKWLSRHKGRIACGVCLECKSSESGHSAKWWLAGQLRLPEV